MRGGFGHLRRFKLGALGLFRAAREKPHRGRYSPSGGINRCASGFYRPTAKTARRGFSHRPGGKNRSRRGKNHPTGKTARARDFPSGPRSKPQGMREKPPRGQNRWGRRISRRVAAKVARGGCSYRARFKLAIQRRKPRWGGINRVAVEKPGFLVEDATRPVV